MQMNLDNHWLLASWGDIRVNAMCFNATTVKYCSVTCNLAICRLRFPNEKNGISLPVGENMRKIPFFFASPIYSSVFPNPKPLSLKKKEIIDK